MIRLDCQEKEINGGLSVISLWKTLAIMDTVFNYECLG